MPKREDLRKILIIGSGPIVIGQACEFDYSGTQAVKALKALGYETVLINSNPATIMTDPHLADRTYVEPIRWETVAAVIEKERPDALLPTMGGQTSLNVTMELARRSLLEKYGVILIGARVEAIELAEDRELFQKAMRELGLDCPRGGIARSLEEARGILETTGLPVIIRPAFTLGGTGGSMAYNREEYSERVREGIQASPIGEVLIEESVAGWKEYELEVMRDLRDNVVIVCPVENVDPMGVHTGDSITVAPAQTLTDREYQRMRNAARAIIRKIGVETGGSNIQFAVNPQTGRLIVVEMNPRVSRSSALASKATGFPIAKIAAQLAVGLNLNEITNEITGKTPACFEPALDYVAVKIPRWNFEKFPQAVPELGPQMKAVGETMALGRTFKEALLKAMRSLELDRRSFGDETSDLDTLRAVLRRPAPGRLWKIGEALRSGMLTDEVSSLTGIDSWFVEQIGEIIQMEQEIREFGLPDNGWLAAAKRLGLSDERLACLCGTKEEKITRRRLKAGIVPVYKTVDTCAAEFASETACLYGTYETENESRRSRRRRVLILGSGPNRIGQGIEFDYCCVHAVMALRELGYETIMVNNNPETVSTDYDTADKLYFEPLTLEDVMHIVRFEKPFGVIVQFGGQTPLKLARGLEAAGVPILGTSPESIDLAEDRRRFGELIRSTSIRQPAWGTAFRFEEALKAAREIGYPVLVRPSYVLGGRGMKIVYDDQDLERYIREAAAVSPLHPILVDQFLEDALEFDVDALCDGNRTVICGCMQHIEEAGIHSGDSSCVLPPYMLADEDCRLMVSQTEQLASLLGVRGLMNVQFALKDGELFLLEVNPRASRTVPFVSKATGIAWAGAAARVMAGKNLDELDLKSSCPENLTAVKTPVFPFMKFPHVQTYLSPEMMSTGEVMGMDTDFGSAFAKAQLAAGQSLPAGGLAFLSVNERDKTGIIPIGRQLHELGFRLTATHGTHAALRKAGIPAECILKVVEGRPNAVDYLIDGKIGLVINTPLGKTSREDEFIIGREAMARGIACVTTLSAAWAVVQAIRTLKGRTLDVLALQDAFAAYDPSPPKAVPDGVC